MIWDKWLKKELKRVDGNLEAIKAAEPAFMRAVDDLGNSNTVGAAKGALLDILAIIDRLAEKRATK